MLVLEIRFSFHIDVQCAEKAISKIIFQQHVHVAEFTFL